MISYVFIPFYAVQIYDIHIFICFNHSVNLFVDQVLVGASTDSQSVSQTVRQSVCLSDSQSVCLTVSLSVCLTVSQSASHPVSQ